MFKTLRVAVRKVNLIPNYSRPYYKYLFFIEDFAQFKVELKRKTWPVIEKESKESYPLNVTAFSDL